MKIGKFNNINFGARLITPPEKFTLPTDDENTKKNARAFVRVLKVIVENPSFDQFTPNDIIELKRLKRKNGYAYEIQYKSHDIKDIDSFEHIHMDVVDKKENFYSISEILGAFRQISYAYMYKTGIFSKERNLPISTTYDECFEEVYKKNFSDFINGCFAKNN